MPNKICFVGVEVTEAKLFGITEMLIGMDIISQGDFSVTHADGKTTFSFRMPSVKTIDYVEDSQKLKTDKSISFLGHSKNKPCSCGSGKNYKNCHGKQK